VHGNRPELRTVPMRLRIVEIKPRAASRPLGKVLKNQ
jgi:hypothetical protein